MSAEEHVATLRRLVAAMNEDDLARVAPEVYAQGFERHDLSGAQPGVRGAAGVTNFIAAARAGMPDVQYQIDDISATATASRCVSPCGGRIVVKSSGTHQPGAC